LIPLFILIPLVVITKPGRPETPWPGSETPSCKIRSILDTDSVLNWTRIPELTGQWIRFGVDSKSSF